ncbi:MAG: biotin transporter BioY [Bacillota bacterium]|nr:biotin transporter BioY [Bacillota bacterium]
MSLTRLIICAMFTALIAILAQIAIPLPFSPVPFTGQVIGVLATAVLLGSKSGLLVISAYLLLGAAGAPVFSLTRGGIYILTGPTGGYLWGFIPAVYFCGKIIESSEQPNQYRTAAAMLTALFFIYLVGGIQLGLIMGYNFRQVLLLGIAPFIPFDLFKAFLAAVLSIQIKKSLYQNRLEHILKK